MFASILSVPARALPSLHALSLLAVLASTAPAMAAPSAKSSADEPAARSAQPASGVVNLNTASEDELVRLPGVGPAKAQAILALRTQLKGFRKLEDLMRVKGIGRKTFRELMPMLTLEGPTTFVERSSSKKAS